MCWRTLGDSLLFKKWSPGTLVKVKYPTQTIAYPFQPHASPSAKLYDLWFHTQSDNSPSTFLQAVCLPIMLTFPLNLFLFHFFPLTIYIFKIQFNFIPSSFIPLCPLPSPPIITITALLSLWLFGSGAISFPREAPLAAPLIMVTLFSLLNIFYLLPEPLVGQALSPYLVLLCVLVAQHKEHAQETFINDDYDAHCQHSCSAFCNNEESNMGALGRKFTLVLLKYCQKS